VRGTVEDFVLRESIRLLSETGEIFPLNLGKCKVRSSTKLKPDAASDIEDWASVISFTLACPPSKEGEEEGILVFTELRDFGKAN
jgi:hypothetical protein